MLCDYLHRFDFKVCEEGEEITSSENDKIASHPDLDSNFMTIKSISSPVTREFNTSTMKAKITSASPEKCSRLLHVKKTDHLNMLSGDSNDEFFFLNEEEL